MLLNLQWMPIAPLIIAFLGTGITALVGMRRPGWAAPVSIVTAALTFLFALAAFASGGGEVILPWAPSWNLFLFFRFDGLAALYTLLASGIGLLILLYSAIYIPHHLEKEHRPEADLTRFFALLSLFMAAMIGLVLAQDLLLMFFFWDITAITSYFLIGYDQHKSASRQAALMALLITGITSVLFLLGALVFYVQYSTFSLPEIIAVVEQAGPEATLTVALGLVAIAALAKSAQVPFHFWLPRAMAAPTPVSAYLHSAAMVAAGVFLLGRFYPLLQQVPLLLDIFLIVGAASIFVSGLLAFSALKLKELLAYSTIAQYGYVVFMLGLGGENALAKASFYVLAHGMIKSALFMTAGVVTEATGEDRLAEVGGLARRLPFLAAVSGIAAAGLAGLPLTIGFFKDEVFFELALHRGSLYAVIAVAAAAFTLAYTWRFWSSIFLGAPRGEIHHKPNQLTLPVAVLALLILLGGFLTWPFTSLANASGRVGPVETPALELAYHLEWGPLLWMTLSTYSLGALLVLSLPLWKGLPSRVAAVGRRFGPEEGYLVGLSVLKRFSDHMYRVELRGLVRTLASIFLMLSALTGMALVSSYNPDTYYASSLSWGDGLLVVTLIVIVISTLIVTIPSSHVTQVLALSAVSFGLTAVFALLGSPDVALVSVLVGSITTIFFLGIYTLFPAKTLVEQAQAQNPASLRWRQRFVGIVSAVFAFAVSWSVLSQPAARESVANEYIRLTPEVHAKDIVTAILADFRGLDTSGEVTVIAIALLGIAMMLRRKESQ